MFRKIKYISFVICVIFLVILFSSCDYGLEITGIHIVSYPNRIVYIKGVDSELDLEGGIFAIELKQGTAPEYSMNDKSTMTSIISDVDFDKEGIYLVKLINSSFECYFPIQVISKESINNMLG